MSGTGKQKLNSDAPAFVPTTAAPSPTTSSSASQFTKKKYLEAEEFVPRSTLNSKAEVFNPTPPTTTTTTQQPPNTTPERHAVTSSSFPRSEGKTFDTFSPDHLHPPAGYEPSPKGSYERHMREERHERYPSHYPPPESSPRHHHRSPRRRPEPHPRGREEWAREEAYRARMRRHPPEYPPHERRYYPHERPPPRAYDRGYPHERPPPSYYHRDERRYAERPEPPHPRGYPYSEKNIQRGYRHPKDPYGQRHPYIRPPHGPPHGPHPLQQYSEIEERRFRAREEAYRRQHFSREHLGRGRHSPGRMHDMPELLYRAELEKYGHRVARDRPPRREPREMFSRDGRDPRDGRDTFKDSEYAKKMASRNARLAALSSGQEFRDLDFSIANVQQRRDFQSKESRDLPQSQTATFSKERLYESEQKQHGSNGYPTGRYNDRYPDDNHKGLDGPGFDGHNDNGGHDSPHNGHSVPKDGRGPTPSEDGIRGDVPDWQEKERGIEEPSGWQGPSKVSKGDPTKQSDGHLNSRYAPSENFRMKTNSKRKPVIERIASGFVIVRNAIDVDTQMWLVNIAQKEGSKPDHGFWVVDKEGKRRLNSTEYRGRVYDKLETYEDGKELGHYAWSMVDKVRQQHKDMPEVIPTHLLLLHYSSTKGIGWHADDAENDGQNDHPIVSFCLGNTCKFGVRPIWEVYSDDEIRAMSTTEYKQKSYDEAYPKFFDLKSGDVAIWGGINRMMVHNVESVESRSAPGFLAQKLKNVRYNFTFRDCTNILGREMDFKYYRPAKGDDEESRNFRTFEF